MRFDVRAGQYRGDDGRFIPRARVLELIDNEAIALQTRLKGIARLAASGKIDAAEFAERFAETLKIGAIQSVGLGSGGIKNTDFSAYGAVGQFMREKLPRVRGFTQAMANGELTEKQILARAAQYGDSVKTLFFWAEKRAQQQAGKTLARRILSPNAQHCAECISYATSGWVSINSIVPVAVACSCAGRCKCRIFYKAG
jgi:hypothetical protein